MINGLLDRYKMDQLIFKFPFSKKYYEHDFFVSSNNFSAYKLVEGWPVWPGKWLNIFGNSGSGKTHLAKILEITGNVAAVTGLDFVTAANQIQRSFAGGIAAADIFREKGVRDMLGFKAGATVSAEETVKAFEKVFGKGGKFGGATDELANTFTGTLSMLGDKLFNFKKNVAGAEFFDELKKEFSSLNKFIEENSEDFEAIANAIGFILTKAVQGFAMAVRGVAKAVSFLRNQYENLIRLLNKIPFVNIEIGKTQDDNTHKAEIYKDKIMLITSLHLLILSV